MQRGNKTTGKLLRHSQLYPPDALAAKPTNIGGRAMIRQPTADDIEMILAVITVSLPRTRWKYSCEREARVQQNKIGIDW